MDHYSPERWMLERHREVACRADARLRAGAWSPQPRLRELMAGHLRTLADRLDRPEAAEARSRFNVVSGSR